ncbi:MAG: quaternary ammonium compound efflux SMR transporter SugE [Rhizobiaceae bacterium]
MAWLYLLAAGLLEIVWATALKYTEGFTRLGPSALTIAAATASFFLLAHALKTLPMGSAYAIWVGIGVGGVAIFGIVVLDEPASLARLGCLALILSGIIGLKVV